MTILRSVRQGIIMENKTGKYDYKDILLDFGREKIEKRYTILHEYLLEFIKRHKYEEKVHIADSVLNQAVIDYFTDIYRLKQFHHIEAVNYLKIHAYTAYWILRRKPLQIIKDDIEDVELAFVNERFVTSYLIQYLRGNNVEVTIAESERVIYYEFVKNLEYYLKYRTVTPQMLETMLQAYQAGMSFEKSIEDY